MRKIDAIGFECSLRCGHLGLALLERGSGVVVVLLTHGLNGGEFLVARGLRADSGEIGFGLGECGLCIAISGLVGGGINFVKHVAGLHVTALRCS